jgi:hypothetical protein
VYHRRCSTQQFFQHLLPVLECPLQAGRDEELLSQITQHPKTGIVLNHIPHQCPFLSAPRFDGKLVAMLKSLEWPFLLDIGEVVVPFELDDQCEPSCPEGKKGKDEKGGWLEYKKKKKQKKKKRTDRKTKTKK